MGKEKIAIIDLDYPKYSVASVGEERYVEVTHEQSGRTREFKTKTEFYGHNTQGGWLADLNKKRQERGFEPFDPEGFTIVQKQRVSEPLANVLHSAKNLVESALKATGATSYEAYLGKGTSFRHGIAKMQEYKGKRKDELKPLQLDEVTNYLQKKFRGEVVTHLEADDKIVMRCKELLDQGKDAFIIGEDKDYRGAPVKFYDANRPQEGIIDCRCFGELWLDDNLKSKPVLGKGRLFKYFQICFEDSVDCYKANKQSKVKWGKMSAYKALKDCKDDKEAWQVLVDVYKKLYPEPVTFESWDGNTYTYSWLDCLQEITTCADMLESEGNYLDVKETLDRLDVEY